MSVKIEVLKALEENRGTFFSGEALANKLNISRAAVWKAIKQLKEEGYSIKAISNKGYSLSIETDVLSREGINIFLTEENKGLDIEVYKELDSTNVYAKQLAVKGALHGTVVLAEEQTAGRGRRGRSFYSPGSTGIYMSIILRPNMEANEAILITTATSVAVAKAIETVTRIKTGIKWVNDIYIDEKKVAGILTEAVTDFESGKIECVIVGIGINFSTPKNSYPDEIKEIATSLYENKPNDITRNQLVAEIINQVLASFKNLQSKEFIEDYKEKSIVIGRDIYILSNNSKTKAKAIDVDEQGGLIVLTEDGVVKTLNSGEISIRFN